LLLGLLLVGAQRASAQNNDAKAIIEKAVKAHGGEDKLGKLQVYRAKMKGTLEAMGLSLDFTSEGLMTLRDRMRTEITLDIMGNKISVLQVFNGQKGWMKIGDDVKDVDEEHLKEMKEEGHSVRVGSLAPLLKDKTYTLAYLGEAKVGDKPAVGVKVSAKGYREIDLWFDKDNGLLVKSMRPTFDLTARKEVMKETYLSDYRDANGMKHAGKVRIDQDGKKLLEGEITEYQILDKADDSEFAKP
jgi:hypothetical protein